MAAEFNPFLLDQQVNIFLVKRSAKRIGVRRLPPLPVRLLVTFLTIGSGGKGVGRNETLTFELRLAGQVGIFAEYKVVLLPDFLAVVRTVKGRRYQGQGARRDQQRHCCRKRNSALYVAECPFAN